MTYIKSFISNVLSKAAAALAPNPPKTEEPAEETYVAPARDPKDEEACRETNRNIWAQMFPESVRESIIQLFEDYIGGKRPSAVITLHPNEVPSVSNFDIYHFYFSLWKRFKPMSRRGTALFMLQAFPALVRTKKERTIYRKMTNIHNNQTVPVIDPAKPFTW